jgi:hypothetical protein
MAETGKLRPGTLASRILSPVEAGGGLAAKEKLRTIGIPVINRY